MSRGLPHFGLPALVWHDATALLGAALSMFVVILAQSAATSRAYAVKYEEHFSEETDLVGLGAANLAAAFSGTFVVNGSPTKTQMVDGGGGRSQLAQLTTASVVVLGVEQDIALAVVASIIEHLRHSYRRLNSVLVKSEAGHWQQTPVLPGSRTEAGLVVYRFGSSPYYANASRLIDDATALSAKGDPLRWMILDGAATRRCRLHAAAVLARVVTHLRDRDIRFGVSTVLGPVREQLDRYGISATLGADAYYDTPGEALAAFHTAEGSAGA